MGQSVGLKARQARTALIILCFCLAFPIAAYAQEAGSELEPYELARGIFLSLMYPAAPSLADIVAGDFEQTTIGKLWHAATLLSESGCPDCCSEAVSILASVAAKKTLGVLVPGVIETVLWAEAIVRYMGYNTDQLPEAQFDRVISDLIVQLGLDLYMCEALASIHNECWSFMEELDLLTPESWRVNRLARSITDSMSHIKERFVSRLGESLSAIAATLSDTDFDTADATDTGQVRTSVSPTAERDVEILVAPERPIFGEVIRFSVEGISTESSSEEVSWDFDGDGAPDAYGTSAQWVYDHPGVFWVDVRSTDPSGSTRFDWVQVTVASSLALSIHCPRSEVARDEPVEAILYLSEPAVVSLYATRLGEDPHLEFSDVSLGVGSHKFVFIPPEPTTSFATTVIEIVANALSGGCARETAVIYVGDGEKAPVHNLGRMRTTYSGSISTSEDSDSPVSLRTSWSSEGSCRPRHWREETVLDYWIIFLVLGGLILALITGQYTITYH